LLQKQNKAYNDYCEKNGLKKLRDRIDVARWDRKQAAAARGAAKRYTTDFTTKENVGTIKAVSGARITNPFSEAAKEHANRYYGLVREMTTDVDKVASITGFSKGDIQEVKNYLFVDKHDLGGKEPELFEPSFDIAQSWQRLINGTPEPHDFTLIQHEIMEKELVKAGWSQYDAHIETSKKYNYARESDDYYAALKEYKKAKQAN